MDKARILRLCDQIEMIIATVCNTGYTLQPGDEEAICNSTKAIMDEVSAPPKSNADRIRQMTDKELAAWAHTMERRALFTDGVTSESQWLEWLKQEVKKDAKSDSEEP